MAEAGGGRGDGATDKAKEEFLSEAQELIDGLGGDMLRLDEGLRAGRQEPELINDIFRAVHTLKGLSGLFGAARMAGVSHELENLLDDLRLGRVEVSQPVLDLLFRAVELYTRLLSAERGDHPEPSTEVEKFLLALGELSSGGGGHAGPPGLAQYELDTGLLGVLTEYEEHRLRTNIQAGLALFRIRVCFALSSIDTALEELKAKARPYGEIITYLPTGSGTSLETIELEILMASRAPLVTLTEAVAGEGISVEAIRKRGEVSAVPPPEPTRVAMVSEASRDMAVSPKEESQSKRPALFADARDISLRSVSQTVRVDIRKLDRLMTIVGELAIVRTALGRVLERVRARPELRELGAEMQRLHRGFDRQLTQMQNGILEVRMVPLGQVFDKLARIVRKISREHEKQINLVITGAETEIDKLIVEELSDPLMHMIRNAIDHGVEGQAERMRVEKPAVGTIALNAFQKGNHVVIEVEDDGRGMNPELILASAIRKGVLSPEEAKELGPREIYSLVFRPGFTTKEVATDISGRGVGLDVVKTNIAKLGGVVDISSEVGIGTKMTITLPITLAIISVLMVEIRGRIFAMPLASVEEAIVFDEGQVRRVEGRDVMTLRGSSLPVTHLAHLFGLERDPSPRHRAFVVVAAVGNRRLGFVVDKLVGQQDIVIKPLGRSLRAVRGFAGATELGDQRVALVLDAAALIEEVIALSEARAHALPRAGARRVHESS